MPEVAILELDQPGVIRPNDWLGAKLCLEILEIHSVSVRVLESDAAVVNREVPPILRVDPVSGHVDADASRTNAGGVKS